MAFRKSTLIVFCIPLVVLLFLEVGTLLSLIKDFLSDPNTKLTNYKWMALGIVGFCLIRYLIIKLHWPFRKGTGKANLETMETHIHEGAHQLVALCLGRRLHSFFVEQHSGMVCTSGSEYTHLPVALAPYCLPWLTLIYVVARVMIKPEWIGVYDMIIGLSVGFHGVCIYKQTRNNQTDINQFPLYFSYLYIATFLVLNILLVLVCVGKDYTIAKTMAYVLKDFWETILSILTKM